MSTDDTAPLEPIPGMIALSAVMRSLDVTYRQVDWWIRAGYLTVEQYGFNAEHATWELAPFGGGSGYTRFISRAEADVLRVMVDLVNLGLAPAAAIGLARRLADEGVVTVGRLTVGLVAS